MAYSILIVDDSALIRQAVKMALELSHFPMQALYQASDGIEAMALLRREFVDLVFLDLNMPKKDGFEVLQEIRASTEWRRLPVVIVSTEVNRESPILKSQGIQAFVVKPFKPETIGHVALEVLEKMADA